MPPPNSPPGNLSLSPSLSLSFSFSFLSLVFPSFSPSEYIFYISFTPLFAVLHCNPEQRSIVVPPLQKTTLVVYKMYLRCPSSSALTDLVSIPLQQPVTPPLLLCSTAPTHHSLTTLLYTSSQYPACIYLPRALLPPLTTHLSYLTSDYTSPCLQFPHFFSHSSRYLPCLHSLCLPLPLHHCSTALLMLVYVYAAQSQPNPYS